MDQDNDPVRDGLSRIEAVMGERTRCCHWTANTYRWGGTFGAVVRGGEDQIQSGGHATPEHAVASLARILGVVL